MDKTILDYIPASIAETLFATRGEMVIFNERLLHAGGFPSAYEDGAERDTSFSSGVKIKKKKEAKEGYCRLKWLRGDLCDQEPTDVAVQFTFEYKLLSAGAKTGGATNTWSAYEAPDEHENADCAREVIQKK